MTRAVIDDLEHFPAVAILGPRQSGKTTLAKSVIKSYPNTLYLDLERHSHLAQLQDAEAFLSLHRDKLVCIDEVQLRPDLFPLLRALIDDPPRAGRFLILGSSSPDLLQNHPRLWPADCHSCTSRRFSNRNCSERRENRKTGVPCSGAAGFREVTWQPRMRAASGGARATSKVSSNGTCRFGVELNPQYMRRL